MAGRSESSGRASLADPVEHLAARGGLPNRELMCRPQVESPCLGIHDLAAPEAEEVQRGWCGRGARASSFFFFFFFFFLRRSPRYYIGANRTLPSTHAIGYVGKPVRVGARRALPQEDNAIPKRSASMKAYHRKATPSDGHVPSTRG